MRRLVEVMGTVVTFDFFGLRDSDTVVDAAVHDAAQSLREADRVFSTYQPSSPMSQLRSGMIALAQTPPEVAVVLELCQTAKELTNGWFDPWSLPGGVDPTGYVKGWAAQRALTFLNGVDADGVIVNAGGDVCVRGHMSDGSTFRVGVTSPTDQQVVAVVAHVTNAIATSGESERGAHLFNAFTQTFDSAVASATVVGPDLGVADALATAICVGGSEVMELVHGLAQYFALTIDHDGSILANPGFPLAA